MKFKRQDKVLITAGKDKGKTGQIIEILPKRNQVVVEGINLYTKHIKPYGGRDGDRVRRERPLPLSKIAIVNDQGEPDRIGYQLAKDGTKQRIFKKTGQAVPEPKEKSATTNKGKKKE